MYKNYRQLLLLLTLFLLPFAVFSESPFLNKDSGKIAVLDVQVALMNTEVAAKAIDELSNSKEWKEVAEELQLKLNEANEIQENFQKEGPTMSDEDKLDAQKRIRSLSQDVNFSREKLNQMQSEVGESLTREQIPQLEKVLTEFMRAKGIEIIFQRGAVLGIDDTDEDLNITSTIIELLNQESES